MDKYYGGVIWTKHAIQRLMDRGIKQGDAWATWKRPDKSKFTASRGGWVYERTFDTTKIEVVAKEVDNGKWLILSVWSKPVVHRYAKQTSAGKAVSFLQRLLKNLTIS